MIKKSLVIVWLLILLSGVMALFWYNDWVYQLPTPVPENYKPIAIGSFLKTDQLPKTDGDKPTFLHFFNPDCPCSRFNTTHFKSLVRKYGQKVNFVVVVMSDKKYTAEAIRDRFGLDLPVVFDATLASQCGVYSTPQAVVMNAQNQLYYRGNYNRSRYCTDESTSYAKMALAGLLEHHSNVAFDDLALKAYGCSLPYCKN